MCISNIQYKIVVDILKYHHEHKNNAYEMLQYHN